MSNETLLSVDIGASGIRAVRVAAYTDEIENAADAIYKGIKNHLQEIDKTLLRLNSASGDLAFKKVTQGRG